MIRCFGACPGGPRPAALAAPLAASVQAFMEAVICHALGLGTCLNSVWQRVHAFAPESTPDCLFFSFSSNSFAPLSYAATLKSLRTLLTTWGGCKDSSVYTLHSMKSTFLSWMAQVGVPEELRAKQGHHKQSSAQLYSRDDVFPQLRAQSLWWQAFAKGFRPLVPRHSPLQEPSLLADAGPYALCNLLLDLFTWESDSAAFCPDILVSSSTGLAPTSSPNPAAEPGDASLPPPCLVESDVDDSVEEMPEDTTPAPSISVPAASGNACSQVRSLKASSGIVHAAVRHPGTAKVCLLCHNAACDSRLFPACGAIAKVTALESCLQERTCKRRACAALLDC